MTLNKLLAYAVVCIVGVIIYNLGRAKSQPAAECYLWMLGSTWLIGLALGFYAWHAK